MSRLVAFTGIPAKMKRLKLMRKSPEQTPGEAEISAEKREYMPIEAGVVSLQGLKHKENQDSYICNQGNNRFFVADGMGGHAYGKEASQMACNLLQKKLDKIELQPDDKDIASELAEAIVEIAKAIKQKWAEEEKQRKLISPGTTLTGIVELKGRLWLAHVGDTRAYYLREKKISQITNDHTTAYEYGIRPGDPTYKMFSRYLGRGLGGGVDLVPAQVDVQELKDIRSGDTFVLASDGLLKNAQGIIKNPGTWLANTIISESERGASAEQIATKLAAEAQSRESDDDVTAIVMRVKETE